MSDLNLSRYQSLSDEFESKTQIIAPIPTKTFTSAKKIFIDYPSRDPKILIQAYKKQQALYSSTLHKQAMIIRILKAANISTEYQIYPLIKLFSDISSELMMTEIEITGFHIYLQRFIWPHFTSHTMVSLYAVAFATKTYFGGSLDPIISHLCEKIPNFLSFSNTWLLKNEDFLGIDIQELNSTFKFLSKKPFNDLDTHYSFYVDYILEIAPASSYEKKWWDNELALTIETSLPDPPSMIKLDSIFYDLNLPPMQRNFSIGSNQSAFNSMMDINDI